MQQLRNASLVTFGCVMAKVSDNQLEKIAETLQEEVEFSFCYTTDNDSNGLTVTPQMRDLTNSGYFLVAVTQFDVNDLTKFKVWISRLTSQRFGSALVSTVRDLVDSALSDLIANQSPDAGRMC